MQNQTYVSQVNNQKINIRKHDTFSPLITLKPSTAQYTSLNILSYSFDKSLDNFIGSFSMTLKDISNNGDFIDSVETLDLVEIYENNLKDLSFIGVITNISVGSAANGLNKIISISGKSIECLFDYFNISVDATAMVSFCTTAKNNQFKLDLLSIQDSLKKPLSIKDIVEEAWRFFKTSIMENGKISSTAIGKIINYYYGDNIFSIADIECKYPVATNLYENTTIKFIDFLRKILPSPAYEIFGKIENNKPVIRIRQVPFDKSDWDSLSTYKVKPYSITSYNFTKSIDEVYTAFYSYIEGSLVSADFSQKLTALESGITEAERDEKKVSLYGYKPLIVNFIGYSRTTGNPDKFEKSDEAVKTAVKAFNQSLKKWYSQLDEMYKGDVSIVNVYNDIKTYGILTIGMKAILCGCTFYVVSEKHNWQYGNSVTINYSIDRGGLYSNGEFTPIQGISKQFAELMNR